MTCGARAGLSIARPQESWYAASTAAAVDRRMARSMPLIAVAQWRSEAAANMVIALPRPSAGAAGGRQHASGAESTGDITRRRCERDGACRTHAGLGEPGVRNGLLLRDWLGGIWEVASGANRLEPGPTELNRGL
jgi:hypothetical protein